MSYGFGVIREEGGSGGLPSLIPCKHWDFWNFKTSFNVSLTIPNYKRARFLDLYLVQIWIDITYEIGCEIELELVSNRVQFGINLRSVGWQNLYGRRTKWERSGAPKRQKNARVNQIKVVISSVIVTEKSQKNDTKSPKSRPPYRKKSSFSDRGPSRNNTLQPQNSTFVTNFVIPMTVFKKVVIA
jgi:hypothetical protein